MFVRDLLVLFCLLLNQSLRLFVQQQVPMLFGRHESIIGINAIFAVHSSTGTVIPAIKFCIIIMCMMLMPVIGVVPLYWLN